MSTPRESRPVILITGAAGGIGTALARSLSEDYTVVGLDQPGRQTDIPLIPVDLGSEPSVREALAKVREQFGRRLASVVHLAAYFDFTGEEHPLYEKVNVQGTRHLLRALQEFEVEQFVYASTMLVHAATRPGERINESTPLAPKWAYPKSKARAEEVVAAEHGRIPYVILRLAGIYNERISVPTLAHQIARIYERDFKSYLYAGNPDAGQSMLHEEDMLDAFRRTIAHRARLRSGTALLIGEAEAPGYDEIQDTIGRLIHGEAEWTTLNLPKPAARVGAWLEQKLEPLIPDAFDQGEKPFIRPYMISMADDHYALDISRARELIGWEPRHRLLDVLADQVRALKEDPAGWYAANHITPPAWLGTAAREGRSAEELRVRHEFVYREQHRRSLWAHFTNAALGAWLLTSPVVTGVQGHPLGINDMISGALLIFFATLCLSWRIGWARWACAAIGFWVLSAPLLMWAPTAGSYLSDTLVGALVIGFAVAVPPEPGISQIAATSGPIVPPGWNYNPSSWTQRLPIIALAVVGFFISRYLAAYQLGHIDNVWEPFFPGGPDPKNGTEEIITSSVSEAWPVSDAGVGALTYILEIITGVIGSTRRWRTMPWLVLLFGLMIAPLGVVSIFFIIIQPIWIGTWCTLCLIAATAMLVQIPYSLDELIATCQFLARRRRAGESLLRVFLRGDTDVGGDERAPAEFDRPPSVILRDMVGGGVNLPWNLGLSALIGVWLMFTRLTLGSDGSLANADHLIGSLVLTIAAIASAEVARPVRLLNIGAGIALFVTPVVFDADAGQTIASSLCGLALILLSLPRGAIRQRYGNWDRFVSAPALGH